MVYVDDLMVLSTSNHAEDVVARIREEWETSKPEEVKEGVKTKFLGIEITKMRDGFHTSQEDYIVDKLSEKAEGKEEKKRRYLAPLPKEMMICQRKKKR